MVQKSFRTIVIHEETYEQLRKLGNVTESFNDVIWKLVQKAVSGQSSFQGRTGQNAAAPSEQGVQNG